MILCYTDCNTAILFIDTETGTFDHYKAVELSPDREEGQLQIELQKIFNQHPDYEEAYQNHQVLEIFCGCSEFTWELISGRLTCSTCAEPYAGDEYPALLVPEILIGRVPKRKGSGDDVPQDA